MDSTYVYYYRLFVDEVEQPDLFEFRADMSVSALLIGAAPYVARLAAEELGLDPSRIRATPIAPIDD